MVFGECMYRIRGLLKTIRRCIHLVFGLQGQMACLCATASGLGCRHRERHMTAACVSNSCNGARPHATGE